MSTKASTHSKYSPSGIAMLATCPGYVPRPMTQEEELDDFAPANVGTRIHKALETRDTSSLLSNYEKNLYQSALNCYSEILERLGEAEYEMEVLSEHKFKGLHFDLLDGVQTGTADVLIRCNKGLSVILDWKTGSTPVAPPETNVQFISYGLLEFDENPDCEEILLGVIQPTVNPRMQLAVFKRNFNNTDRLQLSWDNIPRVRMDEAEAKEALYSTIVRHKRDAGNPYAYRSCASVCPYCKRLGECQKITEMAKKFSYTCIEDEILKAKLLDNVGSAIANVDVLSAMLDFTKVMEAAQKQYKEYAKQCIACGIDLPGYRLSNRGQSVTVDKEAFIGYMLQELGDKEIVDNLKSLPVAHYLEVLINKRHPDADKAEKKEAMAKLISDLSELGVVTTVESKPALLTAKR